MLAKISKLVEELNRSAEYVIAIGKAMHHLPKLYRAKQILICLFIEKMPTRLEPYSANYVLNLPPPRMASLFHLLSIISRLTKKVAFWDMFMPIFGLSPVRVWPKIIDYP